MSSHRQPAELGDLSGPPSLSSSTMSPLSTASFILTALLILNSTLCESAPVDLQQDTTQTQPHNQIDAMCSSYLSADLKFRTSEILGELCVMILVQKSKIPGLQPLFHLVSQLHTRREREISLQGEGQRPGRIERKRFFLYRPRNGRRFIEYE